MSIPSFGFLQDSAATASASPSSLSSSSSSSTASLTSTSSSSSSSSSSSLSSSSSVITRKRPHPSNSKEASEGWEPSKKHAHSSKEDNEFDAVLEDCCVLWAQHNEFLTTKDISQLRPLINVRFDSTQTLQPMCRKLLQQNIPYSDTEEKKLFEDIDQKNKELMEIFSKTIRLLEKNRIGLRILQSALKYQQMEMIDRILKSGTDLTSDSPPVLDCLLKASVTEPKIVKKLLAFDARLHFSEPTNTLHTQLYQLAFNYEDEELAKYLIQQQIDPTIEVVCPPNFQDPVVNELVKPHGFPLCALAANCLNENILSSFLNNCSEKVEKYKPLLFYIAVKCYRFATARLLLNSGFVPSKLSNECFFTSLKSRADKTRASFIIASNWPLTDPIKCMTQALCDHQFDLAQSLKNGLGSNSMSSVFLKYIMDSEGNVHLPYLDWLIGQEADVNWSTMPLIIASRITCDDFRQPDLLQFLLARGANPFLPNVKTPFTNLAFKASDSKIFNMISLSQYPPLDEHYNQMMLYALSADRETAVLESLYKNWKESLNLRTLYRDWFLKPELGMAPSVIAKGKRFIEQKIPPHLNSSLRVSQTGLPLLLSCCRRGNLAQITTLLNGNPLLFNKKKFGPLTYMIAGNIHEKQKKQTHLLPFQFAIQATIKQMSNAERGSASYTDILGAYFLSTAKKVVETSAQLWDISPLKSCSWIPHSQFKDIRNGLIAKKFADEQSIVNSVEFIVKQLESRLLAYNNVHHALTLTQTKQWTPAQKKQIDSINYESELRRIFGALDLPSRRLPLGFDLKSFTEKFEEFLKWFANRTPMLGTPRRDDPAGLNHYYSTLESRLRHLIFSWKKSNGSDDLSSAFCAIGNILEAAQRCAGAWAAEIHRMYELELTNIPGQSGPGLVYSLLAKLRKNVLTIWAKNRASLENRPDQEVHYLLGALGRLGKNLGIPGSANVEDPLYRCTNLDLISIGHNFELYNADIRKFINIFYQEVSQLPSSEKGIIADWMKVNLIGTWRASQYKKSIKVLQSIVKEHLDSQAKNDQQDKIAFDPLWRKLHAAASSKELVLETYQEAIKRLVDQQPASKLLEFLNPIFIGVSQTTRENEFLTFRVYNEDFSFQRPAITEMLIKLRVLEERTEPQAVAAEAALLPQGAAKVAAANVLPKEAAEEKAKAEQKAVWALWPNLEADEAAEKAAVIEPPMGAAKAAAAAAPLPRPEEAALKAVAAAWAAFHPLGAAKAAADAGVAAALAALLPRVP